MMENAPIINPKNLIQRWEPNFLTIVCTIIGIIAGGVFGHALDDPTLWFKGWISELRYQTNEHLKAGVQLRNEALVASGADGVVDSTKNTDGLHKQANDEFRLAAEGGSALAEAYLGQAYCYGWGVARDRSKGLQLIREGWKIDHTLEEWISNPMYCHE